MFKANKTLLFIGPRQSNDGKVGGIVVLFENLLLNLSSKGILYNSVDSNSANYKNKINMFSVVAKKIFQFRKYEHVSLHGTAKDYLIFGPLIMCVCLFFRKSYSLRKFAGNFDEYYYSLNWFYRCIIKLVLKNSNANFFETKLLVQKFERLNVNTFWFPNVRPPQTLKSVDFQSKTEFKVVFLSQVTKDKGVLDLIDAVKSMKGVSLTIAGPISDDHLINFEKYCSENISYIGIVNNELVSEFLSKFHCLALPTYYEGEGYPGVIIEAFMVGLPVISTHWRQIPELVEDKGVLIEPRSIEQLQNAIYEVKKDHVHFQVKSTEQSSYFEDASNTIKFLSKIL